MSDIPDFPWGTLIIIGCVLYAGLSMFIARAMKDYRIPYTSFECHSVPEWHHRCVDLECECECHN